MAIGLTLVKTLNPVLSNCRTDLAMRWKQTNRSPAALILAWIGSNPRQNPTKQLTAYHQTS